MLSTCWLLFLHSAVQLIPSHLNWVEVRRLALPQLGDVLGPSPVEKQMIVPLSTNQMGWRITAECCGSHAG